MPYFIYRLGPVGTLQQLESHDSFSAASAQAKKLRVTLPEKSLDRVKVIFADNPLQAEELLTQVRQPGPPGEE